MQEERDRWARVKHVFQLAIDQPPTDRLAFVADRCGDDEAVRAQVVSLLAAHREAGEFAETPAIEKLNTSPSGRLDERSLHKRDRLGPYEIIEWLDAGGMGEVYRARDAQVGRDVAIKILPSRFSTDPDRLRRFEQEVRSAGSLNHPNLLTIYFADVHAGSPYLVSELLQGETLRKVLDRGPVPGRNAAQYAAEVACGLAATHDRGITHRDLKPENIFLTKDNRIKILDFGLVKLRETKSQLDIPGALRTDAGVVLGTAGYMSPEQARAEQADHRSDIFALGAVLYELMTGRRAFQGTSLVDTMSAVLHNEPADISSVQPDCPPALERIIRRCLDKNPANRFQSAHDLCFALEALSGAPVAAGHGPGRHVRARRQAAAWLAIGATAAATTVASYVLSRRASEPGVQATLRTSILPPERQFGSDPSPALSPDGRTIAFTAPNATGQQVTWVRPLDLPTARALPGTEGSYSGAFWSPDSRSLGFFARGTLQRIEIAGGAPQVLATATNPHGGTWGNDGTVLFAPDATTIQRMSAAGGAATPVTRLDAQHREMALGYPSFLPDGNHFLYWVLSSDKAREGLYLGALDSGDRRQLLPLRSRAEYANGYLFFGRDGNLMAQPFDVRRMEISGEATRVAEELGESSAELSNFAFSVSVSGSVAYWSGHKIPAAQLTWFARTGRRLAAIGEPGHHWEFMVSPDDRFSAIVRSDLRKSKVDIWLLDVAGRNPAALTLANYVAAFPVWSPDSKRVLFTEFTDRWYVKAIHGGTTEEIPFAATAEDYPMSWSSDGRNLLFFRITPDTFGDLWILPLSGERTPYPYLNTVNTEFAGRFSPDSRWVAYTSNESGRVEVYVNSFPQPGNKIRISADGGQMPMWRKDGKELYFVTDDRTLMAVRLAREQGALVPSLPVRLFQTSSIRLSPTMQYAPSSDGQRFLINAVLEDERPQGIHIIHNWKPESAALTAIAR